MLRDTELYGFHWTESWNESTTVNQRHSSNDVWLKRRQCRCVFWQCYCYFIHNSSSNVLQNVRVVLRVGVFLSNTCDFLWIYFLSVYTVNDPVEHIKQRVFQEIFVKTWSKYKQTSFSTCRLLANWQEISMTDMFHIKICLIINVCIYSFKI